MATPTTPFIRQYDPSRDFQAGLDVFLSTIDASLDYEPARTIGAYLWYTPYVTLSPSTCYVLDGGDGQVVGYCIGAADTAVFARRWREEFVGSVDERVVPRPEVQSADVGMEGGTVGWLRRAVWGAECSALLGEREVLERWKAHFHVNVLEGWQREGWGRRLVAAFEDGVRREGVMGVHLDVATGNEGARGFYERLGFGLCEGVGGKDEGVVTMVKELKY